MVARMMRWPWPPAASKFHVRLVIRRVEGLLLPTAEPGEGSATPGVVAELRWKGPRASPLSSLRRGVRRNRTRDVAAAGESGGASATVVWDDEFESVVTLASASHREVAAFQPWELAFTVFTYVNKGPKIKPSILGTASLNLADYAAVPEPNIEIILPLSMADGATDSALSLYLTLSMMELRVAQEAYDASQRTVVGTPLSPLSGDSLSGGKDEVSVIKAGLRKVKILTDLVSIRRYRKTCQDDEDSEDKCYVHSDGSEYPCDIESLGDDLYDGAQEDEVGDSTVRKSCSYGSLQSVNYVGGQVYAHAKIDGEYEDWIYYSNRKSDVGYHVEEMSSSAADENVLPAAKRSILPWRKRKLSLRSLKAKGEPLLKKAYGEEGGDDIDYDRRLLTSSDGSVSEGSRSEDGSVNCGVLSEFGDDNFVVGNWELKEILSRDGHMKLSSQVFFASIDQRSERAAGESACTALVAVIADWFQAHQVQMPIQSQFDSLIHEGSLEWRNLCEKETYQELFPDKHFDLETVLHAKIRPLTVSPSKSFIGFFVPEGTDNMSGFDFLNGAMSFDNIWDEISKTAELSSSGPNLYIVSWNDHFFLLKVEHDAYYIIDTLGERLYEGCSQAYILKFDNTTMIHKVPSEKKPCNPDSSGLLKDSSGTSTEQDSGDDIEENILVSKGKESCKEYIKSFLAAIPIREIQVDIKKGLMASTPLHQRLQIEFHYTESPQKEIATSPPQILTIEAPFEFSWPEPPPKMAVSLAHVVAVV